MTTFRTSFTIKRLKLLKTLIYLRYKFTRFVISESRNPELHEITGLLLS